MKELEESMHNFIRSSVKNVFINTVHNFPAFTVFPIILFIFYIYFLYNNIFLTYNMLVINHSNNILLGSAIFNIITLPGILILTIFLGIFTTYLFQYLINRIYYFPISNYMLFIIIQNSLLKCLMIPFILYIITLCISLEISFLEVIIYTVLVIINTIIVSKGINTITFFLVTMITNKLTRFNISFSHIYILMEFIVLVLLASLLIGIRDDINKLYLYMYSIFLFLGFGIYFMKRFAKFLRIDYLLLTKPISNNIGYNDIKIRGMLTFEIITIVRNYRIFFDFLILSIILLLIFKNVNFISLESDVSILLASLLSPALLGIKQYFHLDLLRFPIHWIKSNIFAIMSTIILIMFLFMLFSLVSGSLVTDYHLLTLFASMSFIFIVQHIIRLELEPFNLSNLHFIAFYTIFSQVLLISFTYFNIPNVMLLLISIAMFSIFIVAGGKKK